jgi:hypothetical protein
MNTSQEDEYQEPEPQYQNPEEFLLQLTKEDQERMKHSRYDPELLREHVLFALGRPEGVFWTPMRWLRVDPIRAIYQLLICEAKGKTPASEVPKKQTTFPKSVALGGAYNDKSHDKYLQAYEQDAFLTDKAKAVMHLRPPPLYYQPSDVQLRKGMALNFHQLCLAMGLKINQKHYGALFGISASRYGEMKNQHSLYSQSEIVAKVKEHEGQLPLNGMSPNELATILIKLDIDLQKWVQKRSAELDSSNPRKRASSSEEELPPPPKKGAKE